MIVSFIIGYFGIQTIVNIGPGKLIKSKNAEIYLMKAFLHQLRGIIHIITAYNVNFPYDDFLPNPDHCIQILPTKRVHPNRWIQSITSR